MKSYKETSKHNNPILNDPQLAYSTSSFYSLSSNSISKTYIKKVMKIAKISVSELIAILPISIDTYKRKLDFAPPVTEKVLEIEEIYRKGKDAFGDSFYTWMNTENITFNGVAPKVLLRNSFGIRLLLDEIGKLEHGVLA